MQKWHLLRRELLLILSVKKLFPDINILKNAANKKKVSYQSQCERAAVNNCIFCSMKSDAVADLIYIIYM